MQWKSALLVGITLAVVVLAIGAAAEEAVVAKNIAVDLNNVKPKDAAPVKAATPVVEDIEDDDEDDEDFNAGAENTEEEEAGPAHGITAAVFYPAYPNLKVPAGERVETLVVLHNAATNPEYEIIHAAGHLAMLNEPARHYQNFSSQTYDRKLAPGETTTIKYSFTPFEAVDPQEYGLVVRVFARLPNDDKSLFNLVVANTTVTIQEPLATDPKSIFTVLLFGGILGGLAYYYLQKKQVKGPVAATAKPANEQDLGRGRVVDKDYVASDHLKFVQALEKKSAVRQLRSTSQ